MGSLGGFSLLGSGWFDGCLSALYGGNTCVAQVPKLREVEITKSGCKTSGHSCELWFFSRNWSQELINKFMKQRSTMIHWDLQCRNIQKISYRATTREWCPHISFSTSCGGATKTPNPTFEPCWIGQGQPSSSSHLCFFGWLGGPRVFQPANTTSIIAMEWSHLLVSLLCAMMGYQLRQMLTMGKVGKLLIKAHPPQCFPHAKYQPSFLHNNWRCRCLLFLQPKDRTEL